MKQQTQPIHLAGIAGRCFGAVALCALALSPTFAFGTPEREKFEMTGADAGVAIGDETIGTLPMWHAGSALQLVRGLPITRPSLFLEGNLFELQNAVAFFQGSPRAAVIPLDANWERVRLVFVDEVMLGFDRLALTGIDIEMGLWMPAPVEYAYPVLSWGGNSVGITPTESRLELPIGPMSANGALDASPLMVTSSSWFGSNALMAAVSHDFLFVAQRH
jgi:hypothetical protein